MAILTSDAAVAVSLALQHGCTVDKLRDVLLKNEDGSPASPIGKMLDILAEMK